MVRGRRQIASVLGVLALAASSLSIAVLAACPNTGERAPRISDLVQGRGRNAGAIAREPVRGVHHRLPGHHRHDEQRLHLQVR